MSWHEGILLFGAFMLGGMVTGYVVFYAMRKNVEYEIERKHKEENATLHGVLEAIHDEVEALWGRYQNVAGEKLEELGRGAPFLHYYTATMDYFTIYNSSTDLIGRIPDSILRRKIITTYANTRGLLDLYHMNNHHINNYDECIWIYRQTKDIHYQQRAMVSLNQLTDLAEILRNAHYSVKEEVDELLIHLDVRRGKDKGHAPDEF